MITTAVRTVRIFSELLQKAGPYLLLEILLPGGTLFAILLFVYRRRAALGRPELRKAGATVLRAIGWVREWFESLVEPYRLAAWVSGGRHRDHDGLEALAIAPLAIRGACDAFADATI